MDTPQTQTPLIETHRQRHYLAVFFLSFMWGPFGVDRFYLGKIGTGILKLITLGGFGIWVLIDLVLIMSGAMRDKQGQPMLQYQEYKRFSYRLVLWFALILGAVMLLSGLGLIAGLYYVVTSLVDGSFTNMIPGLPTDSLLQDNGLNQSDIESLGL